MSTAIRDALDDKVNQVFAGKCVRKDLVRAVKVGANVPVFVLEYLLGKYCASSDPAAIELGLAVEAVAAAKGEKVLTAQLGMEQRLVAGRREQELRVGQCRLARTCGGGRPRWRAKDHQEMGIHKQGQARSGRPPQGLNSSGSSWCLTTTKTEPAAGVGRRASTMSCSRFRRNRRSSCPTRLASTALGGGPSSRAVLARCPCGKEDRKVCATGAAAAGAKIPTNTPCPALKIVQPIGHRTHHHVLPGGSCASSRDSAAGLPGVNDVGGPWT